MEPRHRHKLCFHNMWIIWSKALISQQKEHVHLWSFQFAGLKPAEYVSKQSCCQMMGVLADCTPEIKQAGGKVKGQSCSKPLARISLCKSQQIKLIRRHFVSKTKFYSLHEYYLRSNVACFQNPFSCSHLTVASCFLLCVLLGLLRVDSCRYFLVLSRNGGSCYGIPSNLKTKWELSTGGWQDA